MSELTLNYIFPDEEADVVSTAVNPDMHNFDVWVDSMVRTNPDTIFFYTIPTTDIWEDEKIVENVVEIMVASYEDSTILVSILNDIIEHWGFARKTALYDLTQIQSRYVDLSVGWVTPITARTEIVPPSDNFPKGAVKVIFPPTVGLNALEEAKINCKRSDCPRSLLCSGVCSEASQA